MRLFGKCFDYFVTGMGFGAMSYLCILAFANPGVAPTVKGVVSVFIISGCIGLLALLFSSDLPITIAIGIHFVGTLLLFLLMELINNWPIDIWTLLVFILLYVIIWIICILEQLKTINKLNDRIKRRNMNRK
ncbi:DUF3021 domain-containing protein [uncultured Lactobacillus sp.]|uniref:DUF3021 domain-containing protein n=1 Tax=uncultured Lactobacillus sp. TaxID=153152 RepID=UPI002632E9DD|nr:DUF3021 domain-containing protein [uncultured Lactobacillus sp.]